MLLWDELWTHVLDPPGIVTTGSLQTLPSPTHTLYSSGTSWRPGLHSSLCSRSVFLICDKWHQTASWLWKWILLYCFVNIFFYLSVFSHYCPSTYSMTFCFNLFTANKRGLSVLTWFYFLCHYFCTKDGFYLINVFKCFAFTLHSPLSDRTIIHPQWFKDLVKKNNMSFSFSFLV